MKSDALPVTVFVRDYIAAHNWGPTVADVAHFLGVKSKSTAWARIDEAVTAGQLVRGAGARQLAPTKDYR